MTKPIESSTLTREEDISSKGCINPHFMKTPTPLAAPLAKDWDREIPEPTPPSTAAQPSLIYVPTVSNDDGVPEHIYARVGSTGRQGGDSGHGGRIFLRLACEGGDFRAEKTSGGVDLIVGGDWEMESFVKSLEFALSILQQKHGNGANAVSVD